MARITYIPNRVINANGVANGASIYVYRTGTTTSVSLYSDAGLTVPITNPYVVAAGAAVPFLYHGHNGNIRLRVVSSDGSVVSDDDPHARLLSDTDLSDSGGAALVGAGETTLAYQIQATPAYYGVVDDPNASNPALAVNQATALQAWLTACVENRLSPYAPNPIRVFSASTLTYNPPLSGWNKQADLRISNLILYSSATTGFIVGSATTNVDFATLDMPSVIRHTVDWSGTVSDLKAAVVIYSSYKCTINRGLARFFTKGYLFYSKSAGFSNNTINGGQLSSNRYNEVFLCDGENSYCNENNINGTDYGEFSTTDGESGDRFATVFTRINSGYAGANNNRFNDCCYQGIDKLGKLSVAVWIDGCGSYNYWFSPRWEAGRGPFMRADSKANGANAIYGINNEVVHKGYDGGTASQQFRIEQRGGAFGNIYRGIYSSEDSWQSGDLRNAVYSGGGAGVFRVQDGFYLSNSGPASRELDLLSACYNNIHGAQFSTGGIFARFDTTKIKNFLIQGGFLKGFEGRLFVEAFDAAGTRLTGTITDGTGTEMYVKSAGLAVSGNFGGGYNSQSDNNENFAYITVRDEVASIGVAYVGGTKNIVCSSFTVRGFSTYNNAALEVITGGIRTINPLFDGAGHPDEYGQSRRRRSLWILCQRSDDRQRLRGCCCSGRMDVHHRRRAWLALCKQHGIQRSGSGDHLRRRDEGLLRQDTRYHIGIGHRP